MKSGKRPHLFYVSTNKFGLLASKAGCLFNTTERDFVKRTEEYLECIARHPEISQHYKEFRKSPNIYRSDLVILTDLTVTEEVNFILEVGNKTKTLADFPADRAIQIYPSKNFDLLCKEKKELSSGKVKIGHYYLTDGTKVCQIDLRGIDSPASNSLLSLKTLEIIVPHVFSRQTLSGEIPDGLSFVLVGTKINPKLEQIFYQIVNSVKFV